MPLLSRSKRNIARELDSAATAGDAAQSRLCAIAAAGVLVSIVANAALHWWRLDPAIGLAIATLAIHEARQAWAGNVCGNCAPATLACRTSPDSDYCEKSAA
jgi:divalent metal cation (Fe/Co/Zn/Cd) transporter